MSILSFALMQMAILQASTELRKEEIIEQWHESKNFPRKKKKEVRKHLNSMYSVLSWQSKMFEI